ncbi:glycoside hydrolase family 65 protein [Microbispora sp. RL4-1S]|uniref:Glycoside hydrolase family 65 protein n=1 Tax=Microbispora oryzae TaxID=2806554 RepID=A0A940WE39_9ACTN|nr:glycoside hydrolase family 65 protein [Microbispora oryzae]MBP2703909.1 glycoside hydrolase family 65 protein [Microbispora oryzae]
MPPVDPWSLVYEGFDPELEGRRESLCTLGNGRFATRGAAPEAGPGGGHYPGTYVAGCYDRLTSTVAGHEITAEDMVNLPNWLPLSFAAGDGEWFSPRTARLLGYRQELDMRHAVLHRAVRFVDAEGRATSVRQRRVVSMADPFLAALETVFLAENWSGPLRVRAGLDGRVTNSGVPRYAELRGDHLVGHETGTASGTDGGTESGTGGGTDGSLTWLRVRTRSSGTEIVLASRLDVAPGGGWPAREIPVTVERHDDHIAQTFTPHLERGRPVIVTKTVALTTSRDLGSCDAFSSAVRRAARAPEFGELLRQHAIVWRGLWERARLEVPDPRIERDIHLSVFHLLQTLSPHTAGLDVGVPARGLHGEAYRGHVFWDELFVLPWLTLRFPEVARAVLRYRVRRLPEARAAARAARLRGAMFPWQSGGDGRDETQRYHLNPRSGRWTADHTRLQRHVGLAVAYNAWHHYAVTGDMDFLAGIGAPLLIEISRFFASLARLNPASGRYEIHGVMGPDEYHDAYPGASSPGLDNNAYTNIMAVWLLLRARQALELLPRRAREELRGRLRLTGEEIRRWDDITRRMRVDFLDAPDGGVIGQFTGYERLAELDWERYRGVRRLDRVLEAEGDTPNRYKASKQADVLMLFYLLTSDELGRILARLGYQPRPGMIRRTVRYYLARTCHGSTLSSVVHAWVLARSDRAGSWRFFTETLTGDLADVQGGTTAEGIHLGAMAGTADLLQRCYLGLDARHDGLHLRPLLPEPLTSLSLSVLFRGAEISIDAEPARVRISRADDGPPTVTVSVHGRRARLRRGESRTFRLPGPDRGPGHGASAPAEPPAVPDRSGHSDYSDYSGYSPG